MRIFYLVKLLLPVLRTIMFDEWKLSRSTNRYNVRTDYGGISKLTANKPCFYQSILYNYNGDILLVRY